MNDLTEQAKTYEGGLPLSIDGQGFTSHFVICGDSDVDWTVDTKENLLILESLNGTEFIDIDSIARIFV